MIRSCLVLICLAVSSSGATAILAQEVTHETSLRFKDISDACNLDFTHSDGGSGDRFIMEYVASGMAVFDYDGDGLEDIFFLNGSKSAVAGAEQTKADQSDTAFADQPNRLYRNLGNWKFADVTQQAGLTRLAHSLGTAVADFDNDGDQDIFVNNFGSNDLFENQGDGTFQVFQSPTLTTLEHVGAGACFLDIENDGDLDLFVANYVHFDRDTHPERTYRGKRVYPSPQDFEPEPDNLFRNNGDGTFENISQESGIQAVAGTGMGAVAADFNGDGACDIFVCNDVMENFLYLNDGNGNFAEDGLIAGVALDFAGLRQGSMGVDLGDINGDLHEDLIVTSFQGETPVIYENAGSGFFDDTTPTFGGLSEATPEVTWGVCLADFDRDADLDLFMASGHLMDNIRATDDMQTYESGDLLYENDGESFVNVTGIAGTAFQRKRVSRGSAVADFDQDGDLDIIVLNLNAQPSVYRNDCEQGQSVQLRLVGNSSMNRDGITASVTATTQVSGKPHTSRRTLLSGRGYQSSFGRTLFFAARTQEPIQIEIAWPDSSISTHTLPPQNTPITIRAPN